MRSQQRMILVLGFALFAMFFGAGNLIFPPTLGRQAGPAFWYTMLGFVLTGVGLPLMGVIAVAKSEGGIDHIARRVDPYFATALTIIIMLAIGPLLAIPRTCATTFELGIKPLLPWLGSWLFSFVYFGAVLFFALNPLSVIDRIGKILTPLLLTALALIIAVGIVNPIGPITFRDVIHPFGRGFVEGYQTMDLMASVIFGIIILNEVRSKGLFERSRQLKVIVMAGIIAAGGLALIYGGLVFLGATTVGLDQQFTRTELVSFIANSLLGRWGGISLAVAVGVACLTTAIGLTVMCGEFFNKITHGRLNYKAICISVAAVSLIFSNAGVEQIIRIAVPPLVSLYPVVMVLVFLSLLSRWLENRNIWRGAVVGAFAVGLIEATGAMGFSWEFTDRIYQLLPFTAHGLGWLFPAAILATAGSLIKPASRPIFRVLAVSPASTGTRVALFDNEAAFFEEFVPHPPEVFSAAEPTTQSGIVMDEVMAVVREHRLDHHRIDAVAGRGGFTKPLPSGVYRISEAMLNDLNKGAYGSHASNWGAFIARKLGDALGVPSFVVDPVVVDEMGLLARITGLPELRRHSIFHASTHKAVVRRVARNLWKRPDKVNVIVAHMGDGVSVAAHERGRAIDVNNALDGDGPFSSIAAGTLPTGDLVKLCYSGNYSENQMLARIRDSGGLRSHLGTSSVDEIEGMMKRSDEKALMIVEAMAYQIAKAIGACASVLKGRVDGIALSGEFVASKRLVNWIRDRVRFIAPVFTYPRENEALAITQGVLTVLHGEAEAREYPT